MTASAIIADHSGSASRDGRSSSSSSSSDHPSSSGSRTRSPYETRRTVGMRWNDLKKKWEFVEGSRDPTVQEIVEVKYEAAIELIVKQQQQLKVLRLLLQQQQQEQQPSRQDDHGTTTTKAAEGMDPSELFPTVGAVPDVVPAPAILQQDMIMAALASTNATVADADSASLSEVFNNNSGESLVGIRNQVFYFLSPHELAKCRVVSKDWYRWGVEVLMDDKRDTDPSNHCKKKAFTTTRELKRAVNDYVQRHPRYGIGWPATRDEEVEQENWQNMDPDDRPSIIHGERYDHTNPLHVRLFQTQCTYGTIKKWDVSHVEDFSEVFDNADQFNEPLEWDTRKATNMRGMFACCVSFNSRLGPNFDTSNVTDMSHMFHNCYSFNQDVKFDTSNVTNMANMFYVCSSFNQDVKFDTSNVTNMDSMFYECSSFNQDVKFDTSNVTKMAGMFYACSSFNQDVKFDTSSVTTMSSMFRLCCRFNKDVSNFDTSKVTRAYDMFEGCDLLRDDFRPLIIPRGPRQRRLRQLQI